MEQQSGRQTGDKVTAQVVAGSPSWEQPMKELENAMLRRGVSLSTDLTMLLQAIEWADTTNFAGPLLSGSDTTTQAALETLDAAAPLASPTFTGVPAAPTADPLTGGTQLATCAYTDAAIVVLDAVKAPLASPTLTGVPAAPTAAQDTDTTQVATTAFVQTAVNASEPTGAGSFLPAGSMCATAANLITDTRTPIWSIQAGADAAGAGTLGPFANGGVITGYYLYFYGDGAGTDAVNLAVYIGAYADGDDITAPTEENTGTAADPYTMAMPTSADELTKTGKGLATGNLTVAAGDIVPVYLFREGTADAYGDDLQLVGIELEWESATAATWADNGNSMAFDESNDSYLASSAPPGAGDWDTETIGFTDHFTIAAWVKPTDTGTGARTIIILSSYTSGTQRQIELAASFASPDKEFIIQVDNETVGELKKNWFGDWVSGTWYHVVVTWDGTADELKGYVDGVLDETPNEAETDAVTITNDQRFILVGAEVTEAGSVSANKEFHGNIKSIGVWDEVLTQAEITELAGDSSIDLGSDSGDYVSSSGLVHYYDLGIVRNLKVGWDYSGDPDAIDLQTESDIGHEDIVANAP